MSMLSSQRTSTGSQRTNAGAEVLWQEKAACKGPQAAVFFPPSHLERKDEREEREMRAKDICSEWRGQRAGIDYAIEVREPHGIWGGLSEVERKMVIAQRAG